jgi:hypothetical protein
MLLTHHNSKRHRLSVILQSLRFPEAGAKILIGVAIVLGSYWLNAHVATFSFLWWLSTIVMIATIPILFGIGLAIVLALGITALGIWAVIWLVEYVIQNPW